MNTAIYHLYYTIHPIQTSPNDAMEVESQRRKDGMLNNSENKLIGSITSSCWISRTPTHYSLNLDIASTWEETCVRDGKKNNYEEKRGHRSSVFPPEHFTCYCIAILPSSPLHSATGRLCNLAVCAEGTRDKNGRMNTSLPLIPESGVQSWGYAVQIVPWSIHYT